VFEEMVQFHLQRIQWQPEAHFVGGYLVMAATDSGMVVVDQVEGVVDQGVVRETAQNLRVGP
jgi:hypothetical protein